MSELQSLSQIFQNRIFRIPDYQRGYAWQDAQLRDFWDDLINLQEDRNHYTGLLSLKMLTRKEARRLDSDDQWLLDNGFSAYHIVDGQQRLTTFIILLNELLNCVKAIPENRAAAEDALYLAYDSLKEIRAKYLSRQMPPNGLVTTCLFGYENDNPSAEYLKYNVLGHPHAGTLRETYYTKNLKHAKAFFAKEVAAVYGSRGMAGLSELYRKLTLHLMFNIHEIEDDYDVFVAFETMNNRGKRLTNLELLKNRLIYLTTLFSLEQLDEKNAAALRAKINRAWKEVYFQIGRNKDQPLSDDEFLRAHWILYFSYSRKKGDDYIRFLLRKFSHKAIFGSSAQAVPDQEADGAPSTEEEDPEEPMEDGEPEAAFTALTPKEIADYVDSIYETAQYWYYTFYPEDYPENGLTENEILWIGRLNRIGIGYFRPLIAVSLIPGVGASAEERVALYRAIERLIFINFRLAVYQSSYKSSDYHRKTRQLYRREISIQAITQDINDTAELGLQDKIRSFVIRMNRRFDTGNGFYDWRDLRYFLYEYEHTLAVKNRIEKLDWGVLTKVVKDKITVEHIFPQTPSRYYWKNMFRQFDEKEKAHLAGSLGNLLPLSHSINSSLQNMEFSDKIERGYRNGCHSEVEISCETDWDAERIYKRGIRLLHFMEERWGFKFESREQMDELLHISFVHDGRAIPDALPPLPPSIQDERKLMRQKYWTYALPVIRAAFGPNGPYSNVNPSPSNYADGYFGVWGIHLYCSITTKPRRCLAGLWIDAGNDTINKRLFDYLYAQRAEIEAKVPHPIHWDRKEGSRSCGITVFENRNYLDQNEWEAIAAFHAETLKQLADAVFYPYEDQIREILT